LKPALIDFEQRSKEKNSEDLVVQSIVRRETYKLPLFNFVDNINMIVVPEYTLRKPKAYLKVLLCHAFPAFSGFKSGESEVSTKDIVEITKYSESTVKITESKIRQDGLFYRVKEDLVLASGDFTSIYKSPDAHDEPIIAVHRTIAHNFIHGIMTDTRAKVWSLLDTYDSRLATHILSTKRISSKLMKSVFKDIGKVVNCSWEKVREESLAYEESLF